MKVRRVGRLIRGRGKAEACTYHHNCGALPTHRIRYVYSYVIVTPGVCAKGAKEYRTGAKERAASARRKQRESATRAA